MRWRARRTEIRGRGDRAGAGRSARADPLRLGHRLSGPCADCGDLKTCAVRLIMIEARNAIASVLDHRTLAEMRAAGQSART